jgi:hypothetical protein
MSDKRAVCELDDLVREGDGTYNIKDTSILTNNPGSSQVIRMEPSQFFRVVGGKEEPTALEVAASGANFQDAEGLNEAMLDGEPIPIPFVEYKNDTGEIVSHEGRQRMKVAQETGVRSVPVKLQCLNENFRPEQCEVSNTIELITGPRRSNPVEPQFDLSDERFQEAAKNIKEECNK